MIILRYPSPATRMGQGACHTLNTYSMPQWQKKKRLIVSITVPLIDQATSLQQLLLDAV